MLVHIERGRGVGHVYNVIYGVDNGHWHASAAYASATPGIVDIKIRYIYYDFL